MKTKELLELCIKEESKEIAKELIKSLVEESKESKDTIEKRANELYLQNYNNQGDCAGLEKYYKQMNKKFAILTYLPWATAERLFLKQGGRIEVVNLCNEITSTTEEIDFQTGEKTQGIKRSYFITLKAYWQGRELEENYPVFNSSTMAIINNPDAKDINASKQRGMVRLIARISGIGLKIFEQTVDDSELDTEQKKDTKKDISFLTQEKQN